MTQQGRHVSYSIRDATRLPELDACMQLYINSPYGVDPANTFDYMTAKDNFFRLWQTAGHRLRLCYEGDSLVGWLLSRTGRNCYHTAERSTEQLYYATEYSGFKAFRVLKLLHEDLLRIAIDAKASSVQSHASHLDKDLILCKLLAKCGWSATGYLAYRRLAPALAQNGPRGATWGAAGAEAVSGAASSA